MTNSPNPAAADFACSSDREQKVIALRSLEELQSLTLEELGWIADASTERCVQNGHLIFTQESPPHHLIFVLNDEMRSSISTN